MLDLDHFKDVNDHYGHGVGDKLLHAIGLWLSNNLRAIDLLCRYGGEEFAILMPGIDAAEAEKVAWRLCQTFEAQIFRIEEISIQVTASIGIAVTEQQIDSIETLIYFADFALYQAKQEGRNCVRIYRGNNLST
ncbi:MAG: GGDEF domain-containing protein [Anaerolineales bacterium]|nr:GGDEF domain-containing protein [Anaerolineales bacterium]